MRPDSLRIRELRVDGMRTVLREAGGQATGKRPSSFTATPTQAPTTGVAKVSRKGATRWLEGP